MTQTPYRRSNYFIKKEFQTRFIIRFCLLVIAAVVFCGAYLYFFAENGATAVFKNSRLLLLSTPEYLFPWFMKAMLFTVVVVGFSGFLVFMYISHQIAGALFNIERHLKSLGEGDWTRQVRLRATDQMHELGASVNKMIVAHVKDIEGIKTVSARLQQQMKDERWAEAKVTAAELDKKIRHFKTP